MAVVIASSTPRAPGSQEAKARRCRAKFLRYFPKGFSDPKYLLWERDYKANAHARWLAQLGSSLLDAGDGYRETAARIVAIESRTNLLFSFEKMALRDAVRSARAGRSFVRGLHNLLHGRGALGGRFDTWCTTLAELPRRQTRVLTWPAATVFPFLAQPGRHFFLKPRVTQRALAAYGLDFEYVSRPNSRTYQHLLDLVHRVRDDLSDLAPRDMIDIQSYLWVLGSDEYP